MPKHSFLILHRISGRIDDHFRRKGVKLRATVTEFGPVLLSKILELNDTQQSIMSIVFKYCDDKGLPLIDLKDLKKVFNMLLITLREKRTCSQLRIDSSGFFRSNFKIYCGFGTAGSNRFLRRIEL
jgi:hypothetical protein